MNTLPPIVPLDHHEQNHVVVMQKPLGRTQRGLIGEFLQQSGMEVLGHRRILVDSRQISRHYEQFIGEPFFIPMVEYYTGQSLTIWLARGTEGQLRDLRRAVGGPKVDPGSFRELLVGASHEPLLRRYGVLDNGIHVSDSFSEGLREARVWLDVPPVTPIYDSNEKNSALIKTHRYLWISLTRLPYPIQYSATNNWTAVPDAPIDLDYRVLVPVNAVERAAGMVQLHLPHVVRYKVASDARTGAAYVKLQYPFRWGKADIAVVPRSHYSKRIGLGHLIDLLPVTEQRAIQVRKIQAHTIGKHAYDAEKAAIKMQYARHFGIDH